MIVEQNIKFETFEKLPESLKGFFKTIKKELPEILPDILVGIYVYGSISYNAFDPKRSDVDVAAIIKRKLNEEEIQKLTNWYQTKQMKSNKWISRLEMDFITLENITTNISNDTETTRFAGNKLKEKANMDGAIMDWENIRSCGIVLYGKTPDSFIPEINEDSLFEALIDKFENLKQNIPKWQNNDLWSQVFIVTQLCRVIYALENNGKPISKKQATQWCKENSPFQFKDMISFVLQNINAGGEPTVKIVSENLPAFVAYIDKLFSEKTKNQKF
ncbi:aminoglycoside adenylyltransferase domain-containing protein [Candidatus Absconditicoccus praedator]|uniref:nucleotidyltransferase domain-containing protein n=1 Tax=Candidatus Absconditicoccus praedator TaxID=2735562 RepID=UPI001E63769C|nr:nucleotidyltransferase domain-containing protein [Candidatus Absconditicoccus praedator]UFX83072.1 DUF4111 domain-containing protein [Candidatus Absconditicoccus praedator]